MIKKSDNIMNVKSPSLVSKQVLVPFILVTSLFALWGFANDITNPMVAAFGTLMELSNAKAAWVQLAFYGGYATMAIPAAIFVRRFNYKKWNYSWSSIIFIRRTSFLSSRKI